MVGVPGRALTPSGGRSGTVIYCSCMKDPLLVPDLAGHRGAGANWPQLRCSVGATLIAKVSNALQVAPSPAELDCLWRPDYWR